MRIPGADSPSDEDVTFRAGTPARGEREAPKIWKRYVRLNPLGATVIATACLSIVFGLDTNQLGFQRQTPPSPRPAEAVDISLRRLVRIRVFTRLNRERRLNGSILANRSAVDDEIERIREHPLYVMIKEKMTDHLKDKGYQFVPVRQTQDPRDPMLSIEAETTLHNFIHSIRAICRTPNQKVAAFLREHEEVFGKSIAFHDGAGGYDLALSFLIQVLFEYPDDLSQDVGAVRFSPLSAQEIEETFRGKASTH
jgi:hypothetical protein